MTKPRVISVSYNASGCKLKKKIKFSLPQVTNRLLAPRGKGCAYLRHRGEKGCLLPGYTGSVGIPPAVGRGTDDCFYLGQLPPKREQIIQRRGSLCVCIGAGNSAAAEMGFPDATWPKF